MKYLILFYFILIFIFRYIIFNGYYPKLNRQTIISKKKLIRLNIIDIINENISIKDNEYEFIIFNNTPKILNLIPCSDSNKITNIGHSSFPNINQEVYLKEMKNKIPFNKHFQVKYAGQIKFINNKIIYWSNHSGHYQPDDYNAIFTRLPIELFRKY